MTRQIVNPFTGEVVETTENIFCPTGKGGGIDPSCGGGKGSGGSKKLSPQRKFAVGKLQSASDYLKGGDREAAVADIESAGNQYPKFKKRSEKILDAVYENERKAIRMIDSSLSKLTGNES